jgi:hypothetical protein
VVTASWSKVNSAIVVARQAVPVTHAAILQPANSGMEQSATTRTRSAAATASSPPPQQSAALALVNAILKNAALALMPHVRPTRLRMMDRNVVVAMGCAVRAANARVVISSVARLWVAILRATTRLLATHSAVRFLVEALSLDAASAMGCSRTSWMVLLVEVVGGVRM